MDSIGGCHFSPLITSAGSLSNQSRTTGPSLSTLKKQTTRRLSQFPLNWQLITELGVLLCRTVHSWVVEDQRETTQVFLKEKRKVIYYYRESSLLWVWAHHWHQRKRVGLPVICCSLTLMIESLSLDIIYVIECFRNLQRLCLYLYNSL